MKKYLLSILLCGFVGLCLAQPMSGTYTINFAQATGGTNFQTFSAAFASLTSNGVSAPVTINVVEGTYNEQVYLGNGATIPGASAVNRVTIQTAPSNTNMPILQSSTDPIYWYYSNMSHITIKGLNIRTTGASRVLNLYYGTYDDVVFEDNVLDGYSIQSTSNLYSILYSYYGVRDNFIFRNNVLNDGTYGVYYYYGGSNDFYIDSNVFDNQSYYGVYHYASSSATYASRMHINANEMDINGYTTTYGIYTRYNAPGTEVIGNNMHVESTNLSSTIYGIYFYYANYGATTERALIGNNMVITGDGTGTHYGMYVYYTKNTDVWHNSVLINSTSTNARSIYYYLGSSLTSYGNNTLYNNIFATSTTSPYTAYIYQPYNWNGGGNNMFWNGDGHNTYWYTTGTGAGTTTNLLDFETQSLTTGNFVESPGFLGLNDLHVFNPNIDGAGYNVGLDYDIDDDVRITSIPDIGADEFVVPPNDASAVAIISPLSPLCSDSVDVIMAVQNMGTSNLTTLDIDWTLNGTPQGTFAWVGNLASGAFDTVTLATQVPIGNGDEIVMWTSLPNNVIDPMPEGDTVDAVVLTGMAGNYTIGSSPLADYANFTNAVNDLHQRGVCTSVVFEVEDGVYNEQISFGEIFGVSDINTVTFKSHPSNTNLAELTYASSSALDNYIVDFAGAKYITIDSLRLVNTGASFATVANFTIAQNCTIQNSELIGNTTPNTTSTNIAVIYNPSGIGVDSCSILNNAVEGGSYAAYWYGSNTTTFEYGNNFTGNSFTGYYYSGLFIYYQSDMIVEDNYIEDAGLYTTSYGMYRYYNPNAITRGNHIVVNNTGTIYGLYTYYVDGLPGQPAITSNNFIAVTSSTGTVYGLRNYYGSYHNIENNSVNVTSGSSSSYGTYIYVTSATAYPEIRVMNNISAVTETGMGAIYVYNAEYIEWDNNAYYHPNGTVGYAGSAYATLDDLQTATSTNLNSIVTDPQYVSTTDLHVCAPALQDAGQANGLVDDIDGNNRIGLPDIGADEFMPGGPFDLGPDTTICASDYDVSVDAPFASILWSVAGNPSSTENPYPLAVSGAPQTFNINVVVTTEHCGLAYGSQQIKLVPNIEFDSAAHVCPGDTLVLDAGGGFQASYDWFPSGSSAKTRSITQAGVYVATKTEAGCVSSDTIEVTASDSPDLNDMEACEADMPITVDATINGGTSYAWSGGSSLNDPENDLSTAGTYTVTINDVYGCNSEISFELDVYDEPNAQITLQTVSLNAYTFAGSSSTNVGPNAIYAWNFGNNNAVDTGMVVTYIYPYSGAPEPPTYNVQLTIINDCGDDVASLDVTPGLGTMDRQTLTNSVKLYPNPVDDLAVLKFVGKQTNINVNVIDLTGRTVMSIQHPGTDKVELNLDNLASGSYIISVYTDQAANIAIPVVVK